VDRTQLEQLEQALGIRLPPDYQATLLAYPFAADSPAEELWLLNDADQLLAINRSYRREGFFGVTWPPHYFAVGSDGGGTAYLLDLSQEPAPVLSADHETGELTTEAPDLPTWLRQLHQELAMLEADARQMAEARAHRRWWQFWVR
jgi:hypothetical protein